MIGNVKTDYIFSSTDTSNTDSERARKAIEAVREAVRASKVPDPSNIDSILDVETSMPNIGISMPSDIDVVHAVTDYFSQFDGFFIAPEYEIQIGDAKCRADIVLRDEDGNCAAIAECKLLENSNYSHNPLKIFLYATDAPFGILASGIDSNSWHFYENLHHNQFRLIEQSDFETRLNMQTTRELA